MHPNTGGGGNSDPKICAIFVPKLVQIAINWHEVVE